MAISETKGQGWRAIPTQYRKATDILTSTLAAFLFSSHCVNVISMYWSTNKNKLCGAVWRVNAARVRVHYWRALHPAEMHTAVGNLASLDWRQHHTPTVLRRPTSPSTASRHSRRTRTYVLRRSATTHSTLWRYCFQFPPPWRYASVVLTMGLCRSRFWKRLNISSCHSGFLQLNLHVMIIIREFPVELSPYLFIIWLHTGYKHV